MKKKIMSGLSVIFLLTIFIFTTPVQAADFAGHSFTDEDYFAVEVDLAVSDPLGNPDIIKDFTDASVVGSDSNPETDLQFFLSYMNDSGIEVAYSALEKLEKSITLADILPSAVVTLIENPLFSTAEQREALNAQFAHVNATAPFQQLVQHFNTPWGSDAFVTNNFMTLIAYSFNTGDNDTLMDKNDDLYIGYTFSVQAIIDKINQILSTHISGYQVPHFDFEAKFEQTSEGYKFGINYTNMLVLWQKITIEPRVPDILGVAQLVDLPRPGGVVYGHDVKAMSVFDHLAFEYTFDVEEFNLGTTPPITVMLGNVTSQYHIGETNLMVTLDGSIPGHADNWTYDPFISSDTDYVLDIPAELEGLDLNDWGYPNPVAPLPPTITIPLPDMAFYVLDDAKMRMKLSNDFGISVVTATNWFDVEVVDQQFTTGLHNTDNPINLDKDGNTFFWTSFKGKDHYKLRELNFPPYNIDPDENRDVYVQLFNPTGWAISGILKEYFIVEFALAFTFTVFIADKIAPEILYPGSGTVVVDRFLYMTFTEFPEWYGGEIYHDPSYSAVAAMAATPGDTTTDDGPGPTTSPGVPGFELLSVLLAIPPIYALYRKRR